jgi:hypothetical protein
MPSVIQAITDICASIAIYCLRHTVCWWCNPWQRWTNTPKLTSI